MKKGKIDESGSVWYVLRLSSDSLRFIGRYTRKHCRMQLQTQQLKRLKEATVHREKHQALRK